MHTRIRNKGKHRQSREASTSKGKKQAEANLIKQTKLTDGTKRTVLKYVANVDTIAANATLLDISSLAFSLHCSNQSWLDF